MIDRFNDAPWSFWVHLLVLTILIVEALRKWHFPWSKPALAIYGTVIFWYTGDYLTSNPLDYQVFSNEVVSFAFLQVAAFLVVFRLLLSVFAKRFCKRPLQARRNYLMAHHEPVGVQISPRLLQNLLIALVLSWIAIFALGAASSPNHWQALIWPPLHHEKVGMYPLVGLGSGASFIFNAIGYIHVLICALFGLVAVLARGPVRWIAIIMVLLSWPYFWFDRARNKILALILPAAAAFLLLGRGALWLRILVVSAAGFGVSLWFAKVIEYRTEHSMSAFLQSNTTDEDNDGHIGKTKGGSIGQDMLKELCWINTFILSGRYEPNWGKRYFAELVNPIPRGLWAGKPMVGVDYSIARGFGSRLSGTGALTGVSTGMIGQGCVNFGRYLGPAAAATLFALWAAFLARLWCQRSSLFRLALMLIGLGLTLNTGRDLTFLVLFPFAFGFIALKIYENLHRPTPEWRPDRTANLQNTETFSQSKPPGNLPMDS